MIRLFLRLMMFMLIVCVVGAAAARVIGTWITPSDGILFYLHQPQNQFYRELYAMDVARGIDVRVAQGMIVDAGLTISPDGNRVVFAMWMDFNIELFLLDLTTWQPDGRWAQRLTDNEVQDAFPAWSPDGRYIAFQSLRNGQFDLYRLDLSNGDVQQLTDDRDYDALVVWSPDSTRIAYPASFTGDSGYSLYILDLTTGERLHLWSLALPGPLAWSADGTSILFVRSLGVELYLVEIESGRVSPFLTGYSSSPVTDPPAWSPDSQEVAFSADGIIYVSSGGENTTRRLSYRPGSDSFPVWLP
jgi:TolB protein